MKRYVRAKTINKSSVSASRRRGYADASKIAKKYPKAMRVLG